MSGITVLVIETVEGVECGVCRVVKDLHDRDPERPVEHDAEMHDSTQRLLGEKLVPGSANRSRLCASYLEVQLHFALLIQVQHTFGHEAVSLVRDGLDGVSELPVRWRNRTHAVTAGVSSSANSNSICSCIA